MSQDATVTEVKPAEVNVLDLIKNKGLITVPTDSVDVYTNAALAMEIDNLLAEQAADPPSKVKSLGTLASSPDGELVYSDKWLALDAKIDMLYEELEKSKITFHLRGIVPALRDTLLDTARAEMNKFYEDKPSASQKEKDEYAQVWFTVELLRRQIDRIEVHSVGGVQNSIEHDELEELLTNLYGGEATRLYTASFAISNAAATSTLHEDAGFRRRKSAGTSE